MAFPRWAPLTWYMFHKLAYDYHTSINANDQEKRKESFLKFFQSMRTIIPCKTCRNHFIENTNMEEYKIEENMTPEKIFSWTVRLHNLVNKMHNKKIYSVEDAKKLYAAPLAHQKMYAFMNDYVMYNLNKGVEKDTELINMLTQLCYLYPNRTKQEKLIKVIEKVPIQKEKVRQWLTVFYTIVNQK